MGFVGDNSELEFECCDIENAMNAKIADMAV